MVAWHVDQGSIEIPEGVLEEAARAANATLERFGAAWRRVSLVLVDDDTIRALNRDFRGKDATTDVLSFTLADGPDDEDLGEVLISAGRAIDQARFYGHGIRREIAFLAVHGVLHLLGYDHGTPEEEKLMTRLQEEVLEGLGITR